MAYVLALLATNRRGGFTAAVLGAAAEAAAQAGKVEVETVCLARYRFGPCLSSFWCARNGGEGCVLPDDMGAKGAGELYQKVRRANGLLLATPVHTWGPSALAHVFWERLYPFLYSDGLNGLPFGALACATNQGFQRQAVAEMGKWAFCRGVRYLGGVAAHAMQREAKIDEARRLGAAVGRAAVVDARGRRKFSDAEKYAYYVDGPWDVLQPYLDNIADGQEGLEGSLAEQGRQNFVEGEASELAGLAQEAFVRARAMRQEGDEGGAYQALMRASAYWTRATWKEFVEGFISKRDDVEPYRGMPEPGTAANTGGPAAD